MTPKSRLFETGKIGKMELKNRLVMPAMGNNYASEEGHVTQRLIDGYVERAKGGVAMLMPSPFNVSPESHVPMRTGLSDDKLIDNLHKLTDAVHQHDARICAQLIRRSGSMLATALLHLPGISRHPVFVPSRIPTLGHGKEVKDASVEDIAKLVEDFGEAARRAKEAGCDAVEIHGNNGVICAVSSFMSAWLNRRTDQYGGTAENRARMACEILVKAREKVGPDFPLIFRLSGFEGVEGGNTTEDVVRQAVLLEEAGADAISVGAGMEPWTIFINISPYVIPKGITIPVTEAIKKAVKIPVIAAGRLNYTLAEEILKERKADFIGMARPLLADPYLPDKLKEGRPQDIVNCVYCNNCMEAEPRRCCTVNPSMFREREFELKRAASPKRVIVAGGGLAGMETARVLAERGHKVTLYERSEKLGGQWNIAAQLPDETHFAGYTSYLSRGLDEARVDVRLNQELTPEMVREQQPDAVVVATGATPVTLDVPGADGKNIVQAIDVIAGKVEVGQNVVVVGGSGIGMELGLSLAKQGKDVSIIAPHELGENGKPLEHTIYYALVNMLMEHRIPVYQNAIVAEIRDKSIFFFYNRKLAFMKADTVILAMGFEPEKGLAEELKQALLSIPVYEIGDCKEPRNAEAATSEAAEVARQI